MSLVTTRGTAKSLAKTLLDEKSDTFFSQTNQDNLVDEANRIVWRELIKANHEFFLDTAELTYPANADSTDIEAVTVDGAGAPTTPYKIVEIGHTPNAGAISPTNAYTQWRPMRFAERYHVQQHYNTARATSYYHYVLVARSLFVAPIPTSALNVQLFYISPLAAMTGDSDELLAGRAHDTFGDCVAYCLADLMNSKQQGQNPVTQRLWAEALERIRDNAPTRLSNEGGHVRVTRAAWD